MSEANRGRDARAIEGLLVFVEELVPEFPACDRAVWIDACSRARRVALELRAGILRGRSPEAPDRPRWGWGRDLC